MKKITLFLTMACATTLALAQTQRVELYEEFSGENAPTATSVDSALHVLYHANTSKIVPITYETNFPSAPPRGSLAGQDRKDVTTRVNYYTITQAPYARFDGMALPNAGGAAMNGLASLLTQNIIDTTAADINSPFTVRISHLFNSAYDSVTVSMTITATEAFTSGSTLKAQIAMEEATISLPAPTGTNGQKTFYNVCRALIPAAPAGAGGFGGAGSLGTTLPATWTSGQTQTISYTVLVPNAIYNKGQICFAGFVQDSASHIVEQAGIDAIQPIAYDVAITALNPFPFLQCGNDSVTPVATLLNRGDSSLTSCQIDYKLNTNGLVSIPWTGVLAPGASTIVTLPKVGGRNGGNTIVVSAVAPNGFFAVNSNGNSQTGSFNLDSASMVAPMIQPFNPSTGFGSGTFPPVGWFIVNPTNGTTWVESKTVGDLALGSASINMARVPAGASEYLYSSSTNLSAGSTAVIFFSVASAQARTESDSLVIEASDDCANTWTRVYGKGGAGLATAPQDSMGTFTPSASGWRTDVVGLNAFAGKNNVIVRFKAIGAGGGNVMYIDDVNISNSALGIAENKMSNSLNVYPNPFSTATHVDFNLSQAGNVVIQLYNILGKAVYSTNAGMFQTGANTVEFNGESLAEGIYFLQLTSGNIHASRKITIVR